MANVFLAIVGVICAVIVLIQVVSLVLVKSRSLCGSSVYVIRNSRTVSTDCYKITRRQALGSSIGQIRLLLF